MNSVSKSIIVINPIRTYVGQSGAYYTTTSKDSILFLVPKSEANNKLDNPKSEANNKLDNPQSTSHFKNVRRRDLADLTCSNQQIL